MARSTVTSTSSSSSSHSTSSSTQSSQSQSTTQKVLNDKLFAQVMSGLNGYMTDEQIAEYAENLLGPQLRAAIEASQQNFDTVKLTREQEIENLARALEAGIEEQKKAYGQSVADVETAALARGMGRSSYTLQSLANQGNRLAQAVQQLTDENARQSDQIQKQISLAAQQNAQTQGRLNTDYAAQLAAKIQELKEEQRKEYNSNYMTAISAAMGSQTQGTSESQGTSVTDTTGKSSSTSVTTTKGGSSGGGSSSSGTTYKMNPSQTYVIN